MNPALHVQFAAYPTAAGAGLRVTGTADDIAAYHHLRSWAYTVSQTPELQCDLDLQLACPLIPHSTELPINASIEWLRQQPAGIHIQ
jgi:hypothetical protein